MEQNRQAPCSRRPGLELLVAELLKRNRSWSVQRAISEAKGEWTARHHSAKPSAATGDRA